MEYINHEDDFIDALNIPGRSRDDMPILDPNVSQDRLETVYSQIADVMLQVSRHKFAQIGCIGKANEDDEFDDTWIVKHRPQTFNINELVQLGGVDPEQLPQHVFDTAASYYQALADMHMIHLTSQRHHAIDSAGDCRQKYIARCLFRKITREHKLCDDDSGPFTLFCDDLRPGNVLANDKHEMTGVVDWEYTYAAPTGFAHSPPFWLLLELPKFWEGGLNDWTEHYEKVLPTFLNVMKAKEDAAIERGALKECDRLSHHMLKSWQSGDFWLNYAAQKSWAFDMIYWAKIDRRYFGDGNLDDRMSLLTADERKAMDELVARKLRELNSC
ncbi:hypothetical protein ASPCAL11620 [Aspergillus calidoustus]|uniref:Aminoglycoside phosphotransferase domain-containing protein n=1 Tax=Aspergillus calidoustus TaxID=454130 RepID=A0A0U5G9K4_ASPCI|nr:hypothetical protein ASPCAL11620 [Aspergillus calidoustus]